MSLAKNASVSTTDDAPLWINLAANGQSSYPLSVVSVGTKGTKGTVTLNPTATNGVYYNPGTAFDYLSVGQTATDTFTYTVSDGHGGTATATETVTIAGVNKAPTAKATALATSASSSVNANLLATATDPNQADTLKVSAVNTTGTKGTVRLASNGVATYTPGAAFQYLAAGQTATDSFGYTVADNHGATTSATETVTITGTWLPPTANADAAATTASKAVTIAVLANDSAPHAGDAISVTALNTKTTKGSATLNANGTVTYNPGSAFVTLAPGATANDSFNYTVTDAHGVSSTSTVTVTITGTDTPPVAPNLTGSTSGGAGTWLNITPSVTSVQKLPLSIASVGTAGTKGTVSLSPTATNGVFYNPGTAFDYLSVGQTATDKFTYTVSDGHGGTATATETVTIAGVNKAPTVNAAAIATSASASVNANLLANAADPNQADTLKVSAVNTTGTKGTVSLAANGVATYTPGAAFQYLAAGQIATDSFGYTVADNHGASTSATETVTVTGTWLPPTANADAAATTASKAVTIAVLANDSAPHAGDAISVTALNTKTTKGSATLNANGTVTYNPGSAFVTLAPGATANDSFNYTVTDAHGVSSTSTVTVTVTGTDTPPVAPNLTGSTNAGTGAWLNITSFVTSAQKLPLNVASVGTAGTKGAVTLNPSAVNGVFYNPGTAFDYLSVGQTATDKFTYTVSDGHGGTATAAETVTIAGVNKAPTVKATALATSAAASVNANLLATATDPNQADTLKVSAVNTTGTKGTVSLAANGVATYTPGAAFQYLGAGQTATDSFGYTVADNHGATTSATETVTITGNWLSPVASAVKATAAAAGSVTLNLAGAATDPQPGQTLSVSSLNLTGTDGSAKINANGTVTYTPGAAYAGLAAGTTSTDHFSYTVSDGHGGTSSANVAVTVTAAGADANAAQVIYVSPNGSDSFSGKLAGTNADGTDGPLATLAAAKKLMESNPAVKTVYVEGGTYSLSQPLTLLAADSGQSWLAMPGQTPVIQGGTTITGWTQGANGIWTAQAPAGMFGSGGSATSSLFLNGVQQTVARYPDAAPSNPVQGGWLAAAASLPGQNTANSFQFNPSDLPSNLGSASGLYVAIYSQNGWNEYNLPVASINYQTDTINLAGNASQALGAGSRYFIYNAASQLNTAGEWFYNPANNQVSFDAPAGFNGSGVTVGSPSSIIQLNGANNVTIAGLTLTGTGPTGYGVSVNNTTGLKLIGDKISNVGDGVVFAGTSSNDTVQGSEISHTDDSGIIIYPGTNGVTVQGNSIHDIGTMTNGNGIWFTGSSNDVFANNTITNVARNAIGGGSSHGTADASYNDKITGNLITNVNQATSDGGAIYIGGTQLTDTGDVVSGNAIYGTSAAGTAQSSQLNFLSSSQLIGNGIYLDDYASGVTVSDNYLSGNLGGIMIHSGSDNTITGNTLIDTVNAALKNQVQNGLNLAGPSSGNLFTDNTVANSSAGAVLSQNLGSADSAQWTNNAYGTSGLSSQAFNAMTAGSRYVTGNLSAWQGAGYDANASFTGSAQDITKPLAGTAGFVSQSAYDLFQH